MELWIRSQDKENLIMVNEYLSIGEITYKMDHIKNSHNRPFYIESSNCVLGFYSTKERALEILNEIQVGAIYGGLPFEEIKQILEEKNIQVKSNLLFNTKTNTCLYEMPEN